MISSAIRRGSAVDNMKQALTGALFTVVLFAVMGASNLKVQTTKPIRWEYKTIVQYDRTEESLNAYGKDGWELVNVLEFGPFYGQAIFKRPID